MPTLYVLGQIEAGHPFVLNALLRGGVRYARNTTRGGMSRFPDRDTPSLRSSRLCRYQPEIYRSASSRPDMHDCNFTKEGLGHWRRTFTQPCRPGVRAYDVYADTSRYNLGLPGLPPVLAELYGDRAHRLEFIVCLREPLQRLAADFARLQRLNSTRKLPAAGFDEYVGHVVRGLPAYGGPGWAEIARSYRHELVYRSLYALNLEPWFNQFKSNKFVLIPVRLMGSTGFFRRALAQIGATLNWSTFEAPQISSQDGPPFAKREGKEGRENLALVRSLSNETRDKLGGYFLADTAALSEMLLPLIRQDLFLVGANASELNTAGDVSAFLSASW